MAEDEKTDAEAVNGECCPNGRRRSCALEPSLPRGYSFWKELSSANPGGVASPCSYHQVRRTEEDRERTDPFLRVCSLCSQLINRVWKDGPFTLSSVTVEFMFHPNHTVPPLTTAPPFLPVLRHLRVSYTSIRRRLRARRACSLFKLSRSPGLDIPLPALPDFNATSTVR